MDSSALQNKTEMWIPKTNKLVSLFYIFCFLSFGAGALLSLFCPQLIFVGNLFAFAGVERQTANNNNFYSWDFFFFVDKSKSRQTPSTENIGRRQNGGSSVRSQVPYQIHHQVFSPPIPSFPSPSSCHYTFLFAHDTFLFLGVGYFKPFHTILRAV